MATIDNDEKLKSFVSLLNNQTLQEKILEFRMKWGIPPQGFTDAGEQYKDWVISHTEYAESIASDFQMIAKRSREFRPKTDPVFNSFLSLYILFNRFPDKYPTDTHLPSSIPTVKSSGVLGYIDFVFTVPIFFTFENVKSAVDNTEGLIKGIIDNIQSTNKHLHKEATIPVNNRDIQKSFLLTTPGNPHDIIAKTQENTEWLMEFGRALLRESVSKMKDKEVKVYQDKNKHIDDTIQRIGHVLSNRFLYHITELYWANITDETDKINKELGLSLNRGISLGNTGVYQLAQGKIREGLFNLYRAAEEDRSILEKLQHPESDPEKTVVSSLYQQFEDNILGWLHGEILMPYSGLINIIPTLDDIKNAVGSLPSSKRLHLFDILCSYKLAYEHERLLTNIISRGYIIDSLSDLCLWIEDGMRKVNSSLKDLNAGLAFMKLSYPQGFTLRSDNLDDLISKIETVEKEKELDKANAMVLNLVRNFSGHNFESKAHKFFHQSDKYLARISFALLYLKKNSKL